MSGDNPYDWTRHQPRVALDRGSLVVDLVEQLLEGRGCVLMGGRGMGKSVLLSQVAARIRREAPEVTVLCFSDPPAPPTFEAAIRQIEDGLQLTHVPGNDASRTLDRHFADAPEQQGCVLLFDELDQYISPRSKDSLARTLLNHLEAFRRRSAHPIGILTAGGLGLYVLRDYLASAFMSRVYFKEPEPFSEAQIADLSAPFSARGTPLGETVLKSIQLASGGNPALVTYGLQYLWPRSSHTEKDVSRIYAGMRERHPEFLRDILVSVSHPDFSEVPLRVWSIIRQQGPSIPRSTLLHALSGGADMLRMDLDDVLRLLRAAGLVVLEGSAIADPLRLRAVPSILNLPDPSPRGASTREQLVLDLESLLTSIHKCAPDFFHTPVTEKDETGKKKPRAPKRIVPEAVFSAILAIGLQHLGWQVEREAQQVEGRTDLKLSRSGETAIVEVKIWQRNDYEKIHHQLEGYWAPDVRAAAAVMLTDQDLPAFAGDYRARCLGGAHLTVTEEPVTAPLRGHFSVRSTHADGFDVLADHLLLRIPRG